MKHSTLGSCIRSLRKQNNMTQARLAGILGVTDKAVSKWERDLSYLDLALFPRLAEVLGTTVDGLLGECRKEYAPSRLLQVYEMSRDVRTPLHIMLGLVEIIRNHHDDPEMLQKYLDGIRVSGEYLLMLCDRSMQGSTIPGPKEGGAGHDPAPSAGLEQYIWERMDSCRQQPQPFDFSGKRILVAEDMAINREIAGEILRQTGADTEFAENGKICLEKLESAPAGYYDMILMDILMPEMDGLEATRRIRQLPDREKAGIPIIAMTTNCSQRDRHEALTAGMDDFAEKPIFVDRLFDTMRQYMQEE